MALWDRCSRADGEARRGGALRLVLRAAAWAAWGAALLMVGWASGLAFASLTGVWSPLPMGYYLWTSAIPVAGVAATLSCTCRARLAPWRGRVSAAGLLALLAHLADTIAGPLAWGAPMAPLLPRPLSWPLTYAAWCLWGVALATWVLPVPSPEGTAPPSPLEGRDGAGSLTGREREVTELLVGGSTTAQAAEALGISASSVATYRSRACEKLGLSSLDELMPREVGSAAEPSAIDVGTPAAPLLMGIALCAGLLLRLLALAPTSWGELAWALDVTLVLVLLVAPWAALAAYARLRHMRLRTRRVATGLRLVMAACLVLGLLMGGASGASLDLGGAKTSLNLLAAPAQAVLVALLAPYVLWPRMREPVSLDEERCVLYLRGRGAGELQARVLTEIARGRSTPEVCKGLHVARGTVNAYRAQGYERLGVHSSRELADLLARDVGLVPSAGKMRPFAEGANLPD